MEIDKARSPLGILATRAKTPRGSPDWLRIRAEVIERDGQQVLRTSHFVQKIKNPALARQTAANRARHELASWLGKVTLHGVTIADEHWDAKRVLSAARAEMILPPNWLAPDTKTKEDMTLP